MRLFELLQQQIPPQRIAQKIVKEVSKAGDQNISAILKIFLHSVADAAGLQYYVTLAEVTSLDFQWPEQAVNIFRFNYNHTVFAQYGTLLEGTCKAMDKADLLQPLMNIVEVFCKFCDSMDSSWEDKFWEPFSLISLSLLKGIHRIRKMKSPTFPVLDSKCHRLFESAQKGLGHQDSHDIIFKELCLLLAQDYDYFCSVDENVFNIYKLGMEYLSSQTRVLLFTYMRQALENSRVDSQSKEKLIRFLSDSDIIKAYCFFAQQPSINLICSLLRFLQTFVSQISILECISREQLHTIYRNALNPKAKVRSLAIGFYLTYMRRCFVDKLIFRDTIDFYLTHAANVESLDGFIESIWDQFPYLTTLDPYLRILSKTEWSLKILALTAQFAVRVYRKLYQEVQANDDYAQRLSGFLLKLPKILNALEEKWQVVGILLECYSITDPAEAITTIKDFPIAADRFIKYALVLLKKSEKNHRVAHNVAHIMLILMDHFNMHDEMEHFGKVVYDKYKEITTLVERLNLEEATALQHTLTLLTVCTDSMLVLNEEHVFELASDLRTKLIETNSLQELSQEHGCLLDSLAITTYSGCLNILSSMYAQMASDELDVESTVLWNHIHPFHEFLLKSLENSGQTGLLLTFVEAAIRALCDLYIVFNFKLERATYHALVSSVEAYVFTASPAGNQLDQLDLKRDILHSFNVLHKFVQIPTAITWKIVAYFGMAPAFLNELTELLDILFEHNSQKFPKPKLFTYVVPVAIYNLFQRRTQVSKFYKALSAYKKYVETKLPDRTQRVMKVHIVLTIIDMIERAIQIGDISQQANRMNLLANMHILLTDVFSTESNLILSQSRRLQTHPLTREELGTLSDFQHQLSA